jgi:hypothetical protein
MYGIHAYGFCFLMCSDLIMQLLIGLLFN